MRVVSPIGRSAVIARSSTSQPPLWPSVGALLIAGWVGGIATTLLSAPLLGAAAVGRALSSPGDVTVTWLLPALAGALVASTVLPRILRAFCEFELGLGSALVVTLGSSLAGLATSGFLSTLVLTSGAVVPVSATLFLLPQIVSLAVGYQLLQLLARPALVLGQADGAGLDRLEREPEATDVPTDWGRLLAEVRTEVAQTTSVLAQVDPTDVAGIVADALVNLEALADRVDEAQAPGASARQPQLALAAGIRNLQGGLVDLAESAWRGDHRRELSRLRGLDEIEHALARLESVRDR
jgi:hypothetical protein